MSDSNDYKHINCHVLLACADSLHPEQLQRVREKQDTLVPLSEESIDKILIAFKKKLMREIPNSAGYFVLGYDT